MQNTSKQTIRLFGRYLLKYRVSGFFLALAIISASIAHNIPALYYKDFFDLLTTADPNGAAVVAKQLIMVLGTIAFIEGGNWFFWRAATFLNTHVETRITGAANQDCFEILHRHSFSFFNNNFVGSLVKRAHRFVSALAQMLDLIVWTIVPLGVNVVMITIVLAQRARFLAVLVAIWTLVFLTVNWFLTRYKLKYDLAYGEADSHVSGHFADTITNNSSVKLFNGFLSETSTFRGLLEKAQRLQRIRWNLDGLFEAIQALLVIILEIGLMYAAIGFWQRGILTAGDFVLIQAYILSLVNEIWGFGRTIRRLSEALADATEMTEIFEMPLEIKDHPDSFALEVKKGEIVFSDVTFTYHAKRPMFEHLDLVIKPGEKVAFVGPSGSGKSTLIKLLLRMYDLNAGSILIDRQPIAMVTQESLWQAVSLVPQEPILFHRSIMENIRYGKPDASDEEVFSAAKAAHCHEFINRLPEGYATIAGERGLKLSGGERQRISIARAVLRNAPILVLDEATSSLDTESERYIQDALSHIMPGKTVVVIAHRLSTIMQMDRIVVVRHGKIAEEGTHAALLEKKGVYAELWKLQAGGVIE